MRSLPYSIEAFFAVMEQVNQFWFPAVILAAGLMLVAVFLITRPHADATDTGARIVGGILAVSWVWVGTTHQLGHMADLNFMAPVYGIAWIVQGVLIAFSCTLLGRVRFSVRGGGCGWVGFGIALFGLVVYPAAVLLLGIDWRAVPLAGMAPAPTVIVTAGILLTAQDRPPLHLFVIPIAWAGVAAMPAYQLNFPLDYAVPVAVFTASVLAIQAYRRRKIPSSPA